METPITLEVPCPIFFLKFTDTETSAIWKD